MQPSLNWQVKLFHFAFEIFFLLLPLFILHIINVFNYDYYYDIIMLWLVFYSLPRANRYSSKHNAEIYILIKLSF